ncbi:hypothetical protein SEA_HENOCCUS_50 [Streptomyces phage Henoccus]|nr:hypothetical protein SEA_HENOCCUS_50 [Streptomyces phage Henoccus]
MKIMKVGRDKRPLPRWTYALSAVFWAVVAGVYGVGYEVPRGAVWAVFHWAFFVVALAYLVSTARVWLKHAELTRQYETATPARRTIYGHKES